MSLPRTRTAKRTAAALCAGAIVAGSAMTAATANAEPQGNLVAFGDSYFANPHPVEYTLAKTDDTLGGLRDKIPADVAAQIPEQVLQGFTPVGKHGCGQDPNNVPRRLAAQRGLEARDYSCAGATAYVDPAPGATLGGMVDHAIADGALDANTREVVIQYGFNDSYSYLGGAVAREGLPAVAANLDGTYATQKELWKNALRGQIARIRQAAPNARITLADYPEISEPNSDNQCLVHLPAVPDNLGFPAFWIADAERNISAWAQELAAEENVNFAPVRARTAGGNECAPTGQRLIAGVIDTTTEGYNIPVHMSGPGNAVVATIISESMDS